MKKRLFSLAVLSALLLQLLSGCAAGVQESTPPSAVPTQPPATQPVETKPAETEPVQGPITVTDQAGREVTLDAPAEKIVSCYYLVTASLLTLGQKTVRGGGDPGGAGHPHGGGGAGDL